jgi:hypothetical protein
MPAADGSAVGGRVALAETDALGPVARPPERNCRRFRRKGDRRHTERQDYSERNVGDAQRSGGELCQSAGDQGAHTETSYVGYGGDDLEAARAGAGTSDRMQLMQVRSCRRGDDADADSCQQATEEQPGQRRPREKDHRRGYLKG